MTTLPQIAPAPVGDLGPVVAQITGGHDHTTSVVEVFTGAEVVAVPVAGPADVQVAFARARVAQKAWAAWPVQRRLDVFRRFHELVLQAQPRIADLLQVETGKSRRSAFEEFCDVPMVVGHYLKHAPRILRTRRVPGAFPLVSTAHVQYRPRGVVGVLAPWNFPFAIGFCDAVPALMAGNAVVLKPDHRTPLSPAFGLSLLREAGLPDDVMQIVTSPEVVTAEAVIDQADFIMFTGSTSIGRSVAARAAERLIGSCLELGGKNPMLVLDDADVDAAVAQAVPGVIRNSGQLCLHIERILVDRRRFDEFVEKFVAKVSEARMAPGYDYGIDIGGLANPDQLRRVSAQVDRAREQGATVLTGGRARPDLGPTFYEPTVLTDVSAEMEIEQEETFGPVVTVSAYDGLDAAIARANDVDYGLSASVWSRNLKRARSVGARLEAGHVNVNDCLAIAYSSKSAPSGGLKGSGIGERNGDNGMLKFTEPVTIAAMRTRLPAPESAADDENAARQMVKALRIMRKLKVR